MSQNPHDNVLQDSYQKRVQKWMYACFDPRIADNREERCLRFLEEAVELVQALNLSKKRAYKVIDYVYSRDKGEPGQEIGGVMVTLSTLGTNIGKDVKNEAEKELSRAWENIDKIRSKQKGKANHDITAETSYKALD